MNGRGRLYAAFVNHLVLAEVGKDNVANSAQCLRMLGLDYRRAV
jgi:hypothetical protein